MRRKLFALLAALCLVLAEPIYRPQIAHASTAFVQQCNTNTINVTSGSCSFTATTGNVVIAWVNWGNNTSITLNSVTICGTTATLYDNPSIQGGNVASAFAVAAVASSGSCTITATLSAQDNNLNVTAHETSGTSTTVDGHHINIAGVINPGTDSIPSQNITTTIAGDYVMAGATDAAESETISAGTGGTSRTANNFNMHTATEDTIQGSPGAISLPFTTAGGSAHMNAGIIALAPATTPASPAKRRVVRY